MFAGPFAFSPRSRSSPWALLGACDRPGTGYSPSTCTYAKRKLLCSRSFLISPVGSSAGCSKYREKGRASARARERTCRRPLPFSIGSDSQDPLAHRERENRRKKKENSNTTSRMNSSRHTRELCETRTPARRSLTRSA